MLRAMLALFAALLAAPRAQAQDPVDVGVVRQSHAVVVQRLLYPKEGKTEVFGLLGLFPFGAYTFTPTIQAGLDHHLTESLAIGGILGLGYGMRTATANELQSEYGVAPYAFRYLGSVLGGVTWSPVYAKASLDGARVVHFDVYVAGRAGVTLEQSLIPTGGRPVAPTLSPALGTRVFLGKKLALRLEVRDDVLLQWRKLTENWHVKQNAGVFLGVSYLAGKGEILPLGGDR